MKWDMNQEIEYPQGNSYIPPLERKIIFKSALVLDMLVPWRVNQWAIWWFMSYHMIQSVAQLDPQTLQVT